MTLPRRLRLLVLPVTLALGLPCTPGVVPPKDPEAALPAPAADEIRDDDGVAYTPLNPLAGVVPGNRDARRATGPLDLTTLSGSFDYPVLPGLFQDSASAPHTAADLEAQLFQDGYTAGGRPGSLRDYFDEVSYDAYVVGGTVFDWVTAPSDAATYFGDAGCHGLCRSETNSAGAFVKDVLDLNDAAVDFAQYDNDGPDGVPNSGDDDGVVDLLVVLQPNAGGECGGTELWSHLGRYSDWFPSSYTTDDAADGGGQILIEDYVLAPAVACDGTSLLTIGPVAHLYGLHLGLPALWDRDGSSAGVGVFGLMGRGAWGGDGDSAEQPVHPTAYAKALAGWLTPQVVTGPETAASLPAVETNANAREFRRAEACAAEEYFLLSNRQPTGFDAGLPSSGLFVWHADERIDTNDDESRPRVALLPADDVFGLDNDRNTGDAGDPWPGSAGARSWDDGTSPSSRRWGDRPSGASFSNLSDSGDPMTLDLDQAGTPLFHVLDVTVDDSALGDADGVIDPFETVQLDIALSNEGQSDATAVTGTLVLDPPVTGVTVTDPDGSWPDLAPCGEGQTATFEIELGETVPCETELNFRLDVTSSEISESETFSLRVGDWFLAPESQVTSTSSEDAGPPRVAVAPTAAGIAYAADSGGRRVVELTRVDDAGAALGTTTVSQATTGDALAPDVEWNGTEYGVVWEDDRHGSKEIYFARVAEDGTLSGSELRVTDSTSASRRPRLVWNDVDSEWAIVWQDDRAGSWGVYYAHVDAAGAKIGSDVAIVDDTPDQERPAIAWNGTRFAIVWEEPTGTGEMSIWFVPIDAAGAKQDVAERVESNPGDTIRPEITWDAGKSNYGVAFLDYYRDDQRAAVRATRVVTGQSFGTVTIDDGMTRVEGLDIVSDGDGYLLSWVDHRDGDRTVRLARTDGFLTVEIPGTLVDTDAPHAPTSAIDFGDGRTYVAWLAETAASNRFDVHARPALGTFDCGRDNDGDGVDEPEDNCPTVPNPDQIDDDGDDWGAACDCDETDPNVNPGTPETICDGIDNDCDSGTVDAPNEDGDPADLCDTTDANNPDGIGVDCDDDDPNNYPTNTETCDGQDNDCDGSVDEDFPVETWYRDSDEDTYGDPNDSIETCEGNNQGYVSDNTDCDDTRADVNPGELEACSDAVDNDCDGSTNEITGTRYLAADGDDGTECTDELSPCASFAHAIRMACDAETILVAEGDYQESVVIDHPVKIDNSGSSSQTTLRGNGGGTVLSILSSDSEWDGVNVRSNQTTTDEVCIRVGDEAHQGVRGVQVENMGVSGCGIGVVVDSVGTTGSWNRLLSVIYENSVLTGAEHSGTGLLMQGGVGRVEVKLGFARNNPGAGMKVLAPPEGASNQTIVFVGNRVHDNGTDASAGSTAGIVVTDSSDVRVEGNEIYSQQGVDASSDGYGVLLDTVSGINFFCNDMYDNDLGLRLLGTSDNAGVLHNFWRNHAQSAFSTGTGAGAASVVNENNFSGNALAVDHGGDGTLDARHNWWGSADGPDDGGGGTGDPVSGSLDTSNFIQRDVAPVLVKRPVDFGWSSSVAACYPTIQEAADDAIADDLLLIGQGDYREHITISKPLDMEGMDPGMGCSSSKIDGTQSAGEHLPALRISGVSGIDVRNLTIASAGEGTTCGQNTGDEIGLDLQDVSSSTFENLCFEENGVTELRVYGNSDGNLFRDVSIDGMTRFGDGTDECGHRSREGVLIDGGASCEGGAGAIADGNRFENLTVENVTHGFYVKLADDTEIDSNTVSASPAPAWLDGASSFGLVVEMADRTQVLGNQIGGGDTVDGVRVAGRPADSCVTERTDTVGTVLKDNTIENVSDAGLHLAKAVDDPGVPIDTLIECNDFYANGTGVLVDHVGATTPNRMRLNDIRANGEGVRNTAVGTLPAEDNFWNASDGPSGSGGGSGDSVFGSVDFTPWLEGSAFEDNDLDGYSECEGDCDDQDDQLGPGVEETCDGIDNDCDGSIDEDLPLNTYYRDADEDGFGDPNDTVEDCSDTPPSGYVANGDDCDDTDPDIYPDAPEVTCDGIDQGCDGNDDEAPDGDADGYDVCDPADPADGDGLAADCDDTADTVNPGQTETICDGVDNDCDAGTPDAPDEDSDGADVCDVDDPNNPDGVGPDCDDNDPNRSPLENEICDDVDNDCDGSIDEDLPLNTFYADGDGDGYGVPDDTIEDCASTPPAGYADNPDDCDDTDPDVNPAATEVCTDDVDNDCDGSADGDDTTCSGLSVGDLAFASGSKSTLTWTAASAADSHALYRGMIPAAGFAGYDHLCDASEVAGSSAEDPDAPMPGDSYYYLATGLDVDPATGEIVGGPLGTSSQGGSRADSGTISCGPRVYVDPDAAGAGDGLSWADAYTTVSEALAHERAPDRGLEVWITGNVTDDPASLTSGTRAGARLLGGFAGTETSAWERDPDITPSTWDGGGSAVLLDADGVSVVVDGLRMENAGTGVRAGIAGQRIELVGGRFASFTDRAADVDATAGGTLWVTGSRFDASGQHAVRAVVRGGTLDGWIHDNVFDGGSDAAVRLEARASTQDAIHDVSVVGNEIRGGTIGLALGAHGDEASALSRQSSLVASNLIHGTSGEAVRVEASGNYASETAASTTESVPLLIGNTLSDGSAAGLVCSATRTDSTADPSLHQVRAVPEVWNNLVTFFGGIGIEESEDDEATNLVSDPTVIRNDLFGNAGPYRDEGIDDLADVGAVNALSEARDNIAEDPLYLDRANADFHLDAASPVIDQADGASPPGAARDIDGETRSKDGDGDGTARPDLGADER